MRISDWSSDVCSSDLFRMANAGSGRHHLHVARLRPALVAEAVLMADRAFTNIGDDFHVAVRMRRKAGVRGDDIVVPDAKASPVHPVRILVVRKGEMMRSEEQTSELQSLMRISYAVFCLKKKKTNK